MCAKKREPKTPPEEVEETPQAPLQIDPTKYTAPVVLNIAEVQLLLKVIGSVSLSGTPDQLEAMLPMVRSMRAKCMNAMAVIQKKLPKPPKLPKPTRR